MAEVIRDAFGPAAVAERAEPRYDLADWLGRIGYLVFSDYNFYGPDREHFQAVMDLLRERRDAGQFKG